MNEDLDKVWKALADPTRRAILDILRDGPRLTTQIVEAFPNLSRFGVMKHLDVLRQSRLVVSRKEGRRCYNLINAVPPRQIYERWVSGFEDLWASKLLKVKKSPEQSTRRERKRR